jgi:hypothetical protein
VSLPQLNALVADALRELAESRRERRSFFDQPRDPHDEKHEEQWAALSDRYTAAVERVEEIATTLFPAPRAARPRKRR